MKINPDAIRDVLLYIEEKQTCTFEGVNAELSKIYAGSMIEDKKLSQKHKKGDLLYSVIALNQAKYISAVIKIDVTIQSPKPSDQETKKAKHQKQ